MYSVGVITTSRAFMPVMGQTEYDHIMHKAELLNELGRTREADSLVNEFKLSLDTIKSHWLYKGVDFSKIKQQN